MQRWFFIWIFFVGLSANAEPSSWKVGVSAGYSPNFLVNLQGTSITVSGPSSGTLEMEYAGTAEVGAHVWYSPQNSWGFISGFEYGGERKIKKYNGLSASESGASTYKMSTAYFGGAYRWESFFIPLGVNFGFVDFTPAPGSGVTAEVKNGVGALIGFGWFLGEHFVIQYVGRSSTTELNMTSSSESLRTQGMISSATLTLKYMY